MIISPLLTNISQTQIQASHSLLNNFKSTDDGLYFDCTNYKEPNTVRVIKSSRLRWAGHVVRMDDNELPKKTLGTKPGDQRGPGRQISRWIDGVDEDAKKRGCRNWREDPQDRGR